MVFIQLSLLVLLSIINQCTSNAGDAFGLISKVQTYCEYESITMGSKLADYYNSLDEATHKIDRMHIPFISEHLGFGWDHAAYGRSHPTLGLAPSHSTGEGEVTLLQKVMSSWQPSYKTIYNKKFKYFGC